MYATRISRRVQAPPAVVYRALVDPDSIETWRVPDGMTARVRAFDAREGGAFRVSLTYDGPQGASGKSGGGTDTYRGRFLRLVPDELVVEEIEFETGDDRFWGVMTMATSLTAVDGGTEIVMVHEGIPDGIPRADNELGTRMALDRLARLVEDAAAPEH